MTDALRTELYGTRVRLTEQPAAVPVLLRTAWRVPLVVLIVGACRQSKAQREQIIVLNWALRSAETHSAVIAALLRDQPSRPAWVRYEPAMVRATNIAHGLGLLERIGEWLTLTAAGDDLSESIAEVELYTHERALLRALPRPLPLNVAQRLLQGAGG